MKTTARYGFALAVFVTAALGMNARAQDNNNGCQPLMTAVTDLNTGSGMSGQASVCYGESGVQVRISAKALRPEQAYTVWFVYFDDPAKCIYAPGAESPCGPPDLTKPLPDSTNPDAAPAGVFGRMDSAVADQFGTARFSARLQDFHFSPGSHVHLVIFNHGAASSDNYARARQLLTPEAPGLGSPGLGLGTQKGFMAGGAIFHIPVN
jgi:hypothetical protein